MKRKRKAEKEIVLSSVMCDVLGLGSNRSQLPAGRAPVCPSRSYLQAAHRTHGNFSLHWPTEEMRQKLDSENSWVRDFRLITIYLEHRLFNREKTS